MGSSDNQNTVEIELKFPVSYGDETVTHVTVRRPRGKDLKGLKNIKESTNDQMLFISRLIGQPISFVDELDLATDLGAIMEAAMGFLPDSP